MAIKKEIVDPFKDLVPYAVPDVLHIADSPDSILRARKLMRDANPKDVGFDIETYNNRTDIWKNVAALFPYIGGKVRTAQIGFVWGKTRYAIVIDLLKIPEQGHKFIKTLLECPQDKRTIVGHNLAFELLFMESLGIRTTADLFDTQLAARVLSSNLLPLSPRRSSGYGLDLGSCVGRDLVQFLDKDEQTSDWGGSLSYSQIAYAAKDALCVLDLKDIYKPRLELTGQTKAAQADFRVLPIMAACNANGLTLDVAKVKEVKVELEERKQRLTEECCKLLGVDNPNSPAQLLPVFQKIDPKVNNTTRQTLDYLARKNPELQILTQLKQTGKLLGTYIEPWLKMAELTGGTVHPNLKAIGADTGRMSCPTAFKGSVPSGELTKTGKQKTQTIVLGATLQGAPSSTRSYFIARPNHTLLDADFSAIEVRLAAHMYKDPATRLLATDPTIDAHTLMASKIFNVPQEEVTKEQRKIGKVSRFALQYACGVNKLHQTLEDALATEVDIAVAEKAHRVWHETHHMISKRMQIFKDRNNPQFFLRSPLGRLMCTPDPSQRKTKNKWGHIQPIKGPLIQTNGVNWPVQAAGRDLLAESCSLIWQKLLVPHRDIRPLILVHDEILLEVPDTKVSMAAEIVRDCMTDSSLQARYLGDIPLECEVLTGQTWGEAH
jgi:DNA polymerase I-like protein with 3'-5' exonuclease and polymerase domains